MVRVYWLEDGGLRGAVFPPLPGQGVCVCVCFLNFPGMNKGRENSCHCGLGCK